MSPSGEELHGQDMSEENPSVAELSRAPSSQSSGDDDGLADVLGASSTEKTYYMRLRGHDPIPKLRALLTDPELGDVALAQISGLSVPDICGPEALQERLNQGQAVDSSPLCVRMFAILGEEAVLDAATYELRDFITAQTSDGVGPSFQAARGVLDKEAEMEHEAEMKSDTPPQSVPYTVFDAGRSWTFTLSRSND